ncbi:MAG: LemA family protein [Acholeplasmataceae bacterium]|jgi:LemA protein|nr:LemA family protein [Acholeplasmataceae bacterium]MDD4204008.1 LemA family protein [Acholeplasmataceae bacterium]MDD4469208.1 LemA family protein [Acholeplasmataceae bacterium]MDD4824537.1 LemA family protein [Acholeplasmataceae bacterium]MDY0316201.1 LemA family protein [Acholeplasmatales bacterium]
MANELDEVRGPVNEQGRDVNVIEKQLPVKVGWGSTFFEVMLWVLGIIPGVIFLFMKISARNYLKQLEQRVQHNASQIDNYLEQRVQILQNAVGIVEKSVDLDKDVMKTVAAYRGGVHPDDTNRNQVAGEIDAAMRSINVAFEAYPDLKAHQTLADAMQQNSYLQREITAAREVYNDTVLKWNTDIYRWPTKMIVAAKAGYTTRIPFSASRETKEQARAKFF